MAQPDFKPYFILYSNLTLTGIQTLLNLSNSSDFRNFTQPKYLPTKYEKVNKSNYYKFKNKPIFKHCLKVQ